MTVLGQCQKCGGNPSDRDYGQEYWVECEACGFSPGKFQNRFCADVEWNSPIAPTQGADALRNLAERQEPLGKEFSEVLEKNLWDLYAGESQGADARPVAMDAAFDAMTEWPSMTPRAVFYAGWEKALTTRDASPSGSHPLQHWASLIAAELLGQASKEDVDAVEARLREMVAAGASREEA